MNSVLNVLVELLEEIFFIQTDLLVDGVRLAEVTGKLRLRLELLLVILMPPFKVNPELFELTRCSSCKGMNLICSEERWNSLERRLLLNETSIGNLDRKVFCDIVSFIKENDKVLGHFLYQYTNAVLNLEIIDVLRKNVLELIDEQLAASDDGYLLALLLVVDSQQHNAH
jgi:hypothetical protein